MLVLRPAAITLRLQHKDVLSVTHLIIPRQSGTADSCAMLDEREVFEFHDRLG